MATIHSMALTVCDVLGWHEKDVYALNGWFEAYANLLGNQEKALNCIRNALAVEDTFPVTDINQWLHAIIRLIFYELAAILTRDTKDQALKTKIKRLEKTFAPNI